MLPSSEVAGSGEVGGGIFSPRWLHCQAFHPISGRVRNAPKNVTRPPGPLPLPPPNLHVTGPKNQNPMRRAVKGPAQGGAEGKRHRPANNEENQSAVGIRSDFENGPKSQATRRSSALGDTGCQSEKSAKSPLGFKVRVPLGKRHISLPIPRRDSHKTLASALSRARGARRRSATPLIVRV